MRDPANLTRVTLDYNTYGQPTSVTIPSNASASGQSETTTFGYFTHADPNLNTGDLISITDPLGDVFTIDSYDALGDPTAVSVYPTLGVPTTDPTKKLTASILWDSAQRMQLGTLANGVQLVPTYTNGVLTQMQIKSPTGTVLSTVTLHHDSRGRVYKAVDSEGVLAQVKFDRVGNLTQVHDGRSDGLPGNGYKTRFVYGKNGELTFAYWPSGANVQLVYDVAGRLLYGRDERGFEFDYEYDNASRLKKVILRANATLGTVSESVEYAYDTAGRLEFVTDRRNGIVTCTRDYVYTGALKRLTSVITIIAALPAQSNTFTVSYTYKNDGSVATTTSVCGTTTFGYDKAGQVTSLTDPWGDVTGVSCGNISRLSPPGG